MLGVAGPVALLFAMIAVALLASGRRFGPFGPGRLWELDRARLLCSGARRRRGGDPRGERAHPRQSALPFPGFLPA